MSSTASHRAGHEVTQDQLRAPVNRFAALRRVSIGIPFQLALGAPRAVTQAQPRVRGLRMVSRET
jgi:hypothetical protein